MKRASQELIFPKRKSDMLTPWERRIKKSNEKWLTRDCNEIEHKRHLHAILKSKQFNGRSPELEIDNDEITWKRHTKDG